MTFEAIAIIGLITLPIATFFAGCIVAAPKTKERNTHIPQRRTYAEVLTILDPGQEWLNLRLTILPDKLPDEFYDPEVALYSFDEYMGCITDEDRKRAKELMVGMQWGHLIKRGRRK